MSNDQQLMQDADKKEKWWLIYLKGMLMGAVEIVPGVSAGTLALITGILPRLLSALRHLICSQSDLFFPEI